MAVAPPPPPNEDSGDAIAVPVSAALTCVGSVTYSTVGATQSLPGCSGSADDDVWFRFVATGRTHDIHITNVSGDPDIVTQVWDGGLRVPQKCQGVPDSPVRVINLTIGATYYYRVYTSRPGFSRTSFTTCVTSPPDPLPNDDYGTALIPTISPAGNCSSFAVSTVTATQSSPNPTCTAADNNDDVWYLFRARSKGLRVSYSNLVAATGTATRVGYAIYSTPGGVFTQLACDPAFGSAGAGASTIVDFATPLVVGQWYYLQTWTTGTANSGTFDMCLEAYDPPQTPFNDLCTNASSLACGATYAGQTTLAATGANPFSCNGSIGDHIWYTVVGDGREYDFSVIATPGFEPQVDIRTGSSCATATCIPESSAGSAGALAVTSTWQSVAGTTYYIAVGNRLSTGPQGSFSVRLTCKACLPPGTPVVSSVTETSATVTFTNSPTQRSTVTYTPEGGAPLQVSLPAGTLTRTLTGLLPSTKYTVSVTTACGATSETTTFATGLPPANDACAGALPLFGSAGVPTPVNGATYLTYNASASGVPTPWCDFGSSPDDDLWFAVDAPVAGATLVVTAVGAADFDAVVAVYSGDCGTLTQVACVDNTGSAGEENVTIVTALAGEGGAVRSAPTTYYVRVYDRAVGGGTVAVGATLSTPLPVELTSFSASETGRTNTIAWTSAAEVALAGYTVERATAPEGFDGSLPNRAAIDIIAELRPTGTPSGKTATYAATDAHPAALAYYRLRVVDLDGSVAYSDVVSVARAAEEAGLSVYPNPASEGIGSVRLAFGGSGPTREVTVTDATGRRVFHERDIAGDGYELATSTLAAGVYRVAVRTGDRVDAAALVVE